MAKKSDLQHFENVQAIAHLLDPVQTINNGQSGHFDGKNLSLLTHFPQSLLSQYITLQI